MKKTVFTILAVLIVALLLACVQEVTVDTDTFVELELGTFVLNGKSYATLQDAVDALKGKTSKAPGDDIIYLTKDAKGAGAVLDGMEAVIDFGGHTFDFTNVTGLQGILGGDFGLTIKDGSDVTLKGLEKISLNDTSTIDLTMVYVEGSETTLKIEDAPRMVVEDEQYVFWVANGAKLTIGSDSDSSADPKINGNLSAVGTETSVEVKSSSTITGDIETSSAQVTLAKNSKVEGTVSASENATVTIAGNAEVKGAISADSSNVSISENSKINASVQVSNASTLTVSSQDNIITNLDKTSDSKIAVTESIKIDNVASGEGKDNKIITAGDGSVSGATVTEDENSSTYVALSGGQVYKSIADAVSVAKDGERTAVKLINNSGTDEEKIDIVIPAAKDIALDLSKYTVFGNISVKQTSEKSGALEISGIVGETCGLVTGTLSGDGLKVRSGAFTLDPGTHVLAYSSVNGNNPYKVTVNTGGVASIVRDDETLYYSSLSRAFGNGGFPGGVEEGETVTVLSDTSTGAADLDTNNVTLDLDGHTITVNNPPSFVVSGNGACVTNGTVTSDSAYALVVNGSEGATLTDVTVNGGLYAKGAATVSVKGTKTSITGTSGGASVKAEGTGTVVTLYEGSFSHTGTGSVFSEVDNGRIIVEGGTYSQDPSEHYHGKQAIVYNSGEKPTWTVGHSDAPKTIDAETTTLDAGYEYNVIEDTVIEGNLSVSDEGEADTIILYLKENTTLTVHKGIDVGEKTLIIRGPGKLVIDEPEDGKPGIRGKKIIIENGDISVKGGSGAAGISGTEITYPSSTSGISCWTRSNTDSNWTPCSGASTANIFRIAVDLYVNPVTEWKDGCLYTLSANKTLGTRVCVSGNATLILPDDKTLTASKGITVEGSDGLTIMTSGTKKNGALVATGDTGNAAIGGTSGNSAGTVTIKGGNITAKGGAGASGIGKGSGATDEGTLNIDSSLKFFVSAVDDNDNTKNNWSILSDTRKQFMKTGTPVSGITIAANQEIINSGNISFSVSPENPSNKTLKWSIESGGTGGTATINASTGAITAVTKSGPITVKATANDGSGVYASRSVTVSMGIAVKATDTVLGENNKNKIYIINKNTNLTSTGGRIEIKGNVTLILDSGSSFTVPRGFYVPEGTSLTIEGTGSLTINNVERYRAGIGGVLGEENGNTTGIRDAGTITINGGTINITGCFSDTGGAGIGGGYSGNGGTVTINGGTVNATGGAAAAGIGGGAYGGDGGNIVINGGKVVARGGYVKNSTYPDGYYVNGSGIGGGYGGDSGTVEIKGGTVEAYGGSGAAGIGAGISSGAGDFKKGECKTVTITGGHVTAVGGDYGAGIGNGYDANAGTITISGSETTVIATGGKWGPGIGGCFIQSITVEDIVTVNISGGNVTATGGAGAAGIGGGYHHNSGVAPAGTVTISGGTVTATGGVKEYDDAGGGAGIGSGYSNSSDSGAGVNLTISGSNTVVNATGKDGGAGIGGGKRRDGGTVTINGGKVTATGSANASGIGKGEDGSSHGSLTTGSGVTLQCISDNSSWSDYSGTRYQYMRTKP